MNDAQRSRLTELIKEHNVVDNTQSLRAAPQSGALRRELKQLERLKRHHATDPKRFEQLLRERCPVLHEYQGVLDRIKAPNVDVGVMERMIDALETIETGAADQHEASFEVGKLLKRKYIDRKIAPCSSSPGPSASTSIAPGAPDTGRSAISWAEFKRAQARDVPL